MQSAATTSTSGPLTSKDQAQQLLSKQGHSSLQSTSISSAMTKSAGEVAQDALECFACKRFDDMVSLQVRWFA